MGQGGLRERERERVQGERERESAGREMGSQQAERIVGCLTSQQHASVSRMDLLRQFLRAATLR